jgi:predicted alpha/beta superfamily hydrolase
MSFKIKDLILTFLLLSFSVKAQDSLYNVKIQVFTNEILPGSKIYIAGNREKLGNWQPDSIELKRDNEYWEAEFQFEHNDNIEFKFTKGSWDTEALDENGRISNNHNLLITKDTLVTFFVASWKEPGDAKTSMGQITGEVEYHYKLEFENLLPRDIIVWLPPGYYENPDIKYSVLYMNDGQNLFDPSTSFGGKDWQMDEAADSLIRNRQIEPLIIVGIYNTSDRKKEYSDTEKGDQYGDFVVNHLKPFIDENYRTLPEGKNTGIGGSSMGGLSSLLIAWNYSSIISKAACFSPAFVYEKFDHTEKIDRFCGEKKNLSIFIYNGGKGIDTILQKGVNKMITVLKNKGFRDNENLFVRIDSSGEHNEMSWAEHVPEMLEMLFPRREEKKIIK